MRTGIIESIDIFHLEGVILDENDQEIPFYLDSDHPTFKISTKVYFEIHLTHRGLAAVHLKSYD